jgi:hypothetical protein
MKDDQIWEHALLRKSMSILRYEIFANKSQHNRLCGGAQYEQHSAQCFADCCIFIVLQSGQIKLR